MRHSPSEKLRIVLSVRQSRLPVAQAAAEEGISKATYCRWSKRLNEGGADALKDRSSAPHQVWNRLVPVVEKAMMDCALECPELSPRELAVQFSDEFSGGTALESWFYRMLKQNDLVKSPVYVVHIAEKQFRDKTTQPNELWQTHILVRPSRPIPDRGSLCWLPIRAQTDQDPYTGIDHSSSGYTRFLHNVAEDRHQDSGFIPAWVRSSVHLRAVAPQDLARCGRAGCILRTAPHTNENGMVGIVFGHAAGRLTRIPLLGKARMAAPPSECSSDARKSCRMSPGGAYPSRR